MTTSRIVVWNLPAEARNVSTSEGLRQNTNFAPDGGVDLGKRVAVQR
jgi:hypothetical protein